MSLLTKQQIADILWMSWDHGHFEWKGFKWDLMRWNKKQTAQFEIDWTEALQKREPPITSREMYQRGYAAAERNLKREPLSDEEISAINLPEKQCTLRELVRLIEKAHGIGIVE